MGQCGWGRSSPYPRALGFMTDESSFSMAAEGWAELGGEDYFSVGRDIVLDLLNRFCQLLDQALT